MKNKSILIFSYYYFPENTPRAFRTFELVREFTTQGYKVSLLLPNKECFQSQEFKDVIHKNLTVFFVGKRLASQKPSLKRKLILRDFLKSIFLYFNPFGLSIGYTFELCVFLKKKIIVTEYDLLISIAAPFSVHLGTFFGFLINENLKAVKVKIADCGDPLYIKNKSAFYIKYLDLLLKRSFNYISVPTLNAKEDLILNGLESGKIKIIPQGFNLNSFKFNKYKKNKIVSFAYAGIFYSDNRDPTPFFDFLKQFKHPFVFYVFTLSDNYDTMKILNKYKDCFADKLVINFDLPRKDLLPILARMDFLLNIENKSGVQTPSKLIDYEICKRPIISVGQDKFEGDFYEFYNGIYNNKLNIDLSLYDIKKIANRFLSIEEIEK